MEKIESIEEFYKNKTQIMPDNIGNEIGHFNVFKLEPYVGCAAKPVPYRRRDFYKISLIKGNIDIHYADKIIEVKKHALSFSNPLIPYNWEKMDNIESGFFCIFTPAFFHQLGGISQYPLFQPDGIPVFELDEQQLVRVEEYYHRLFEEINSDYAYKYDVIKTIILEMIHFAMKMQPTKTLISARPDASKRITTLFLELLERQFPIDDAHNSVALRTASDFAAQLNIHVNHLNRAVKETTSKTTSQLIAERVLFESKILLKHSSWNVSEIAYSLGFTEVTHFNNFFKKHIQTSPLKYRNV